GGGRICMVDTPPSLFHSRTHSLTHRAVEQTTGSCRICNFFPLPFPVRAPPPPPPRICSFPTSPRCPSPPPSSLLACRVCGQTHRLPLAVESLLHGAFVWSTAIFVASACV